MFTFQVELEKTYFDTQNPTRTHTIYGKMPIQAQSPQEAISKVEGMIQNLPSASFGTLQTTDDRIIWDDTRDPLVGWEYEDLTFSTTGDAKVDEGETDVYREWLEAVEYKDRKNGVLL